jgi:hypothetical protein
MLRLLEPESVTRVKTRLGIRVCIWGGDLGGSTYGRRREDLEVPLCVIIFNAEVLQRERSELQTFFIFS